jgi:phosphoribosylglycinamide formyltransferase-1
VRIGVLASGEGTNLQALLDDPEIEVAAVASDKPEARALERARAAGVAAQSFAGHEDRSARDQAIAGWLRERGVELVVLAGYMQLLSDEFLSAFPQRIINVHPALLPAFPGLQAVRQALDYGVKVFGVTVHFVDGGVDTGPVILQRAVELPEARTEAEVFDRLHPIEHELLPAAVRLIARGAVKVEGRRVVVESGA